MADKLFQELTKDEATDLAKRCKRGARGDHNEIRRRLTEAGFNGVSASLSSTSHTSHGMTMTMTMGTVHGPRGETISF